MRRKKFEWQNQNCTLKIFLTFPYKDFLVFCLAAQASLRDVAITVTNAMADGNSTNHSEILQMGEKSARFKRN